MQNIKNIIFDYGNVIFHIDFQRAQQAFIDLGIKNIDSFFSHSGHHQIFNEFEIGAISPAEFRQAIRDIAQHPKLSDTEIDDAWNSLLIGVPPGNHEILVATKAKYRTFLLSNNNEIHYQWIVEYLKRDFNIDSNGIFFEKDYYSHLLGMRKPNRDIFDFVLHAHELEANETLFIDDSPQHLKTAAEIGLHTHLLKQNESLPGFLQASGLL